jgi:uncharacterized protein YqgC (DUF456 family)
MTETAITCLIGLIMMVGIVGLFIPIFPDLLLIWGAALGYGLIIGWEANGPTLFGLISLLGLLGILADVWMSTIGGKVGGASFVSIVIGSILGFFGMIFLTPLGGIGIILLSIYLLEYRRVGDAEKALRAMLGAGIGFGASFGVKLVVGLGMIAIWVYWAFAG